MKKYYTISDGGTILFGNKDFAFKLYNGFGDCENTVLVFDNQREFMDFCIKEYGNLNQDRAFKWIMPIKGKFNLYDYDCRIHLYDEYIVTSFDGEYSVYLRKTDCEYPILAIVKEGAD